MTRSNRIANRILLLLVALVAIATGLALLVPALGKTFGIAIPKIAAPTSESLWIVAAGCVIVVALSIVWIASRGRGRTPAVIQVSDESGSTTIDARVAADLVSEALSVSPDILSVGAGAYRMRGNRVLSLRVVARKGADLPALISGVGSTIEQLDGVLETRIPVLLQVVSGVRANLAHEVRTR